MPVHYTRRVVLNLSEPDESLAGQKLPGIRNTKFLKVGKQARLFILDQDSALDPVFEESRGPRINVVGRGVRFEGFTENQTHQIMRTLRQIGLAHGRRNLVVGLRDERNERAGDFAVLVGSKGENLSHREK